MLAYILLLGSADSLFLNVPSFFLTEFLHFRNMIMGHYNTCVVYHCFIVILGIIKQCTWPFPHLIPRLFEKVDNQPGFVKENNKNSVWQLAGPAWSLYTFLSLRLWVYDSTSHKKEWAYSRSFSRYSGIKNKSKMVMRLFFCLWFLVDCMYV